MAIILDRPASNDLTKVVGVRIHAARRAAEMTQEEAAKALGYRGVTQVSLVENGKRLPTLIALIQYADLYRAPLDFLVGRTDDPDLEQCETNMAVMARAVSKSMELHIKRVADACALFSVQLTPDRQSDRHDLYEVATLAKQAAQALERIRELNPDFDELKGGAKLVNALSRLIALGQKAEERTETYRRRYRTLKTTLELEEREAMQFALPFEYLLMLNQPESGAA